MSVYDPGGRRVTGFLSISSTPVRPRVAATNGFATPVGRVLGPDCYEELSSNDPIRIPIQIPIRFPIRIMV